MSQHAGTAKAETPSVLLGPDTPEGVHSTAAQFHKRHRMLGYTMDFNRSKEYVVRNPRLSVKHRVYEACKWLAWRYRRDYVGDENGHPLTQKEVAELIGADPQRVCEACAYWVAEHCFRIEGRVIFVIDDPELEAKFSTESEDPANGNPPRLDYARLRANALDYWKRSKPERFKEYQERLDDFNKAGEKLNELQAAAIAEYEAEQRQSEGENPDVADNSASAADPHVPDELTARLGETAAASLFTSKKEEKLASYGERVAAAIEASGLQVSQQGNPNPKTLLNMEKQLEGLRPEQVELALTCLTTDLAIAHTRREGRPETWGFAVQCLRDIVKDVKQGKIQRPSAASRADRPPPQFSLEEEIRIREEFLRENDLCVGAGGPEHPDAPAMARELQELQ